MTGDAPNPALVAAFQGTQDYREEDAVCSLVVQALSGLGLPENFIRPGNRVVLKPNWIKEHGRKKEKKPFSEIKRIIVN